MGNLRCAGNAFAPIELIDGGVTAGFSEQGRYFFTSDLPGTALYIDDAPLPSCNPGNGFSWYWEPGYFAGTVGAELVGLAGETIASYRLDVSPSANKLGAEVFSQMIDELFDFDPCLILGAEAAQFGIGTQGEVTNPHLEYERLRNYGTHLLASLKRVCDRPLLRLRTERTRRSPNQVKKLDEHSVRRALKEPAALQLLRGTHLDAVPRGSPSFEVQLSYDHVDNPANRALAATLLSVIRRSRVVAEKLQAIADEEVRSETRTALAPRIARRTLYLDKLGKALKKVARSEPFRSISRPEISAAGLNAISAHPAYARAFRHGWYILRPGVAGISDERLWVCPTWEIYERWCFAKLASALERRFPNLSWSREYPSSEDDCIRVRGQGVNLTLDVWLQARCPAGDRKPFRNFSSISGQRSPDIMVTMEAGERRAFLVIDAKYRTSREGVLEGMQSAHLYHDCVRWNGLRPVISLLVVPRSGGAGWLEAPEFRQEHGVGVAQLECDEDGEAVVSIIERALLDPTG